MKDISGNKNIALIVLVASAIFFGLGFMFPLLQTGYGIGPFRIKSDYVYLDTSFRYFFDKGEFFIGALLLFFTIIFPIVKYIFLFMTLLGREMPKQKFMTTALEVINKWSMLDVFIVAVLILNMKFDSTIIVAEVESGTSLFALSILLMMTASFLAGKAVRR